MTLPRASSTGGGLFKNKNYKYITLWCLNSFRVMLLSDHGAGSYIEFLVVELSELAEHCGRLVCVLGHGV